MWCVPCKNSVAGAAGDDPPAPPASEQMRSVIPLEPERSFIIPVLDDSPHSPWSILTLLEELEAEEGEVICIINSREMLDRLADHPRIDKYCFNSLNPGVGRSWNQGIALAEGRVLHILNADLHLERGSVRELELWLETLPRAVMVGPEGSDLRFESGSLAMARRHRAEELDGPRLVDNVSGFLMVIHRARFEEAGLSFDTRYTPCFMEEWDIGFQIARAGLGAYVVPVTGYGHEWGISHERGQRIRWFRRSASREEVLKGNGERLKEKWFDRLPALVRGEEARG